jgi:hypothetical protein
MGVRTRGLDIKAGAAKLKADKAARLEAKLVIDRWNRRLATGRDILWSPTIRARMPNAANAIRDVMVHAMKLLRRRSANSTKWLAPTRRGGGEAEGVLGQQ